MQAIANATRHGFTSHEHLDNLTLIHMNGRVFDPMIGRFLSADPHVTDPTYTQSFNRYAYVWNNPLRLIDPTGFDSSPCIPGVQMTGPGSNECRPPTPENCDGWTTVDGVSTWCENATKPRYEPSDGPGYVLGDDNGADDDNGGGGGSGGDGGPPEETKCGNINFGVGLTAAAFAGGGGGLAPFGISFEGSLLDTRLYGQAQAYALFGIGAYGGVGFEFEYSAGGIPRGFNSQSGVRGEFDIGGPNLGPLGFTASVSHYGEGQNSYSGYAEGIKGGRAGLGGGIYMGGGVVTQSTFGLPTLREIYNDLVKLLSPLIKLDPSLAPKCSN